MDKASSQNLLRSSVEILLKSQQSSGCWNLQPHRKDKTYPILNFSKGIPGIIWFLLCYYQYYQDRQVKDATIMALHWMIKKTKYQQIRGLQKLNEALLFIKAFNVLRDDIYYELAERYLNSIPARPILTNYTLQGGLAALGELYLDANEIFNDPKWTVRTDWITQVFLHSFSHIGPNQGYWISGVDTTITADLFTGNAGILHYLIRYSNPGGMKHPLSPSCL